MNLLHKLIVKSGSKVKLSAWDADFTSNFKSKEQTHKPLKKNLEKLNELQYLLYAENKHSVLVVLQAMDAGGKDGTIRTVMGPMNPQSCKVTSFKGPTEEELAHDFLWRIHRFVPRKGEIRIFNRSHYEDVLIVRVHNLVHKSVWSSRYQQINDFEKILAKNDVHVIKIFLHISKQEQRKRLEERLDDATKHWKADPADFEERKYWDEYIKAYDEVLTRCSTDYAPWYVVPANKKWFRNLAVSEILVSELERLKMKFPKPRYDISKLHID